MFGLILTAIGLGFGLAMDAFSVSLANGLHEPKMKLPRMLAIAGTFAIFQGAMPLIGWVCVHTVLQYFEILGKFIPWIAFGLLGFIGGKMIYEGITSKGDCPCEQKGLGFWALIVQGVATSIDALSAGLDIVNYNFSEAIIAVTIIAAITFVICLAGVLVGRKGGTFMAGKAGILGGAILVVIGIYIFVSRLFLS